MIHRQARRALVGLALAWASATGAVQAEINLAAYGSLAECDAALATHPSEVDLCHCYANLANRERDWRRVMAHLSERLRSQPDDPRLIYALGLVDASRGGEQAETTLRLAADRFDALGEPRGEVQALLNLYALMQDQSRVAEADDALARAERVSETARDDESRMFVLFHRGVQAAQRGDFVEAMRCYGIVEASVFPDGHPVLQAMVLHATGRQAAWERRRRDAIERYERAAAILSRIGDLAREASVRYDLFNLIVAAMATGEASTEDVQAARRGVWQAARKAKSAHVELLLLQDESRRTDGTPEEKAARLNRVIEMARRLRVLGEEARALRALANLTMEGDPGRPEKALRLADQAIEIASSADLTVDRAYGYIARALLHRRRGQREAALSDWERALTEFESIRDRQRDDLVQALSAQQWAFTYYRLIAYIMEEVERPVSVEAIERALRVAERLRARSGLEALDQAAAGASAGDNEWSRQRVGVLDAIAAAQRGLSRKDLEDPERQVILSRLAQLDAEEASLRARIAQADPQFAALRAPEYPTLAEVQASLGPDEAVMSFQIGPENNAGGWLFIITSQEARAFGLPSRAAIGNAVTLFLGMLERRDGSEGEAAAALYTMLLGSAGAALPAEVHRLIIVPDGPLHQLPIDVLRETATGELLAHRYDVSVVPSVTAWRRWRLERPDRASLRVLALADPDQVTKARSSSTPRQDESPGERGFGPLPHAREESAAVRRLLGGGVVVAGPAASERFLKSANPNRYQMLHIAAHAVLDHQHPRRSAILLAPGSADEDGLLQIREIVALDLRDRVVVLSACSSAAGPALQGYGVMGIARGFFQAGARSVVGSLYPLRDDEASRLVERLATHLAAGDSMASSLARARREMAATGAPAAAWAGLIVLGDGDFVPFPGGVPARRAVLFTSLGAAGLLIILLVITLRRRHRAAPSR